MPNRGQELPRCWSEQSYSDRNRERYLKEGKKYLQQLVGGMAAGGQRSEEGLHGASITLLPRVPAD